MADASVDFSHLNLLPTYQSNVDLMNLEDEHIKESSFSMKTLITWDLPPPPPRIFSHKLKVYSGESASWVGGWIQLIAPGHVDKQYMHWLGVSLAIPW